MNIDLKRPVGVGRTAAVYDFEDGKVVKLFYEGVPRSLPEIEFKNAKIVQEAKLPVPQVFEMMEYQGRVGLVYEKVEGSTLLGMLPSNFYKIKKLAYKLAEVQYQMHQTSTTGLRSYKDLMRLRIEPLKPFDEDKKSIILKYLDTLPDDDKICHGDYHPDNVMVTKDNEFIVIDWVDVTTCNPIADLARSSYLIRYADPPKGLLNKLFIGTFRKIFHKHYLHRYLEISGISQQEIDAWMLPIITARIDEDIKSEFPLIEKLINGYLQTIK